MSQLKVHRFLAVMAFALVWSSGNMQEYKPGNNSTPVLTVTTVELEPFVKILDGDAEGNDRFQGYIPDLLKLLAEEVPFQYTLKLAKDGKYGTLVNGTWTGMIGELISGDADMAAAALIISSRRQEVVDFSKPFMSPGLTLLQKKPSSGGFKVLAIFGPYEAAVWVCIMIASAVVAILVYILNRFSPQEASDHFNVLNSFWFVFSTLMLQGYPKTPRPISVRFLSIFWFAFVIIVLFVYVSSLGPFLVARDTAKPIQTFEELSEQTAVRYGTIKGGSSEYFFKNSDVDIYKRMYTSMSSAEPSAFVDSTMDGIRRVRKSDGKYALIGESTTLQYYASKQPCDLLVMSEQINPQGYGFAFPRSSNLTDKVSQALLAVLDAEKSEMLREKWWSGPCDYSYSATETRVRKGSPPRAVSLSDIGSVFIFLLIGIILSVIVLLCEVLISKTRGKAKGGDYKAASPDDTTGV
ncbi:glutamate receptor 2-like [Ptychodera flava]|uniref:glutamate receptor 2-like n=1 Tax=Ptychodera flava TaxID=63121 RepID=UPI00396A3C32